MRSSRRSRASPGDRPLVGPLREKEEEMGVHRFMIEGEVRKFCQHCMAELRTDALGLPRIESGLSCGLGTCPVRRDRRSRVYLGAAFVSLAVALVAVLIFCSTAARASSCYGIRDYDKRLECLAVERRSPADCTSIRNPDDRVLCRQRSGELPVGEPPRRWPGNNGIGALPYPW